MATYTMTNDQVPFAARLTALQLNPDLVAIVDSSIEQEQEPAVREMVEGHWVMRDEKMARHLEELVLEIRQANAQAGVDDKRSDDRLKALFLESAGLLNRSAPVGFIDMSKAMMMFFRAYARVMWRVSEVQSEPKATHWRDDR